MSGPPRKFVEALALGSALLFLSHRFAAAMNPDLPLDTRGSGRLDIIFLALFMTSLHQNKHEFNFTPVELKYLLITQKIVQQKIDNQGFNPQKPEDEFFLRGSDIHDFGWIVEDAITEGKTKLLVKMGVLYLLTSVWRSMHQFGNKIDAFKRENVSRMHDMLWDYYKSNAQGK